MNSATQQQKSQEIELKLTLPYSDPDSMVRMLRKAAPLARRKSVHQNLLSIYFDTPEQDLRKRRIALRVRQIESSTGSVWVQTLKTAGVSGSALTLRGEWEEKIQDSNLSIGALEASPWREIDPDGTIYQALAPCFTTRFERTSWLIRTKDHSIVEVALDIGQIESADQFAPICELELELKAGESSSLFGLAQSISANVALVPASLSKAERGYALAQGTLDMPQRSRPPNLPRHQPLVEAAQQIFQETFFQFTRNLDILLMADNVEVVHQARVGWRRFKSALRLFKPVLIQQQIPDVSTLQPLLDTLGQMRDLDVALAETSLLIAPVYTSEDSDRLLNWQKFVQSLADAARVQRLAVRDAVQVPAVGATLLSITRYVEEMSSTDTFVTEAKHFRLDSWTEHRMRKLKRLLEQSIETATDKDSLHRARIHAKRLRYGVESVQTVLPRRLVKRWLKKAEALQTSIGLSRDFQRLHQFAADLGAADGLIEFLRGYGNGLVRRVER
jgi:inorganic triphosphatase YgiF